VAEFGAALEGEQALRTHCEADREVMTKDNDVGAFVKAMSSILPDVDKKALLGNSAFGSFLVENIQAALKMSCDGWIDDDLAFVKPWGFGLDEIKGPILLYQGSEDKMVPYAHGEWLVKNLPSGICQPHLLQGEGHISLVLGRLDVMLDELKGYC
jgi:pimeloyl-ACP methyl ester carboxylesterase